MNLLKNGVKGWQMGVITPYKGQMAMITSMLDKSGAVSPEVAREIEVVSVDGF